jgi:hypothetical protein
LLNIGSMLSRTKGVIVIGRSRCRIASERRVWLTYSDISNRRFSSSLSPVPDEDQNKLFYTPIQKQVMDKCRELHASIMPLNERVRCALLWLLSDCTDFPSMYIVDRQVFDRHRVLRVNISLYSLSCIVSHSSLAYFFDCCSYADRCRHSRIEERRCPLYCWSAITRRASRALSTMYWDARYRLREWLRPTMVRQT